MVRVIAIVLIGAMLSSCGAFILGEGRPNPLLGPRGAVELKGDKEDVEIYVDGELYTRPEGMTDAQYDRATRGAGKRGVPLSTMPQYNGDWLVLKKNKKVRHVVVKKEGYKDFEFDIHREFNPNTLFNIVNLGIYFVLIDVPFRGYARFSEVSVPVNLVKDPNHPMWEEEKKKQVEAKHLAEERRNKTKEANENDSATVEVAEIPDRTENTEFLNDYSPINDNHLSEEVRTVVKTKLSRQAIYHSFSMSDENGMIAFCRADQVMEIRNAKTGQVKFVERDIPIDRVQFSDDGHYVVALTKWDNRVVEDKPEQLRVFDVEQGKWLWELPSNHLKDKSIIATRFSASSEKLAILYDEGIISVDVATGNVDSDMSVYELKKFKFPGKKYMSEEVIELSFKNDSTVSVYTRTLYFNYKVGKKILSYIPIIGSFVQGSATERSNIIGGFDYSLSEQKIVDVKEYSAFEIPPYVQSNIFVKNGYLLSYFANTNQLGVVKLVPELNVNGVAASTASRLAMEPRFVDFPVALSDVEIDSSGIMYYTLKSSPKIYRFDLTNLEQLPEWDDHVAPASDVELFPSQGLIVSSDVNGIKNFWDSSTGDLKYRMYTSGLDNYYLANNENYYYASKGILKDVGFVKQNRLYQFESYDIILNRPDKVLTSSECEDNDLIASFEDARMKRLRKLGYDQNIDLSNMELPDCEIVNKDDITLSTSRNYTYVTVEAKDKQEVRSLVVQVNGVKVDEIDVKKASITKKIKVLLGEGPNRIQVFALNGRGVKSLIEAVEIVSTRKSQRTIYYIGIGASKYDQSDFDLQYADKDVQDLSQRFDDLNDKVMIDTLLNSSVTREKIQALKNKLMRTSINDVVILSINGHGLLDEQYNFYAATHDVDFMNPSERGVSFAELESLLNGIPARNRLMLIDACHSGEIDEGELEAGEAESEVEIAEVTFRGADQLQQVTRREGVSTFQLMRDVFYDLSYSTGTHIISAAGGAEYALESDKWKNGVFTYSVIIGLFDKEADYNKDSAVSVSELKKFVYGNVTTLTNGKQMPTSRRENLVNDFDILTD